MYKSLVPITKELHGNKKLKELNNFNFANKLHLSPVLIQEFSKLASIYPIVFIEDKENKKFKAVTLLGLNIGENLFVKDGNWKSTYIPSSIRRYPFTLAKINNSEKLTICVDESSEFLNDKEGDELFDKEGQLLDPIKKVKEYLTLYQQMNLLTDQFLNLLKLNNMFSPIEIKFELKGEIKTIEGIYIINKEKLNTLNDEKYHELKSKEYISAINNHFSSLSQLESLLRLKNENHKNYKIIELN